MYGYNTHELLKPSEIAGWLAQILRGDMNVTFDQHRNALITRLLGEGGKSSSQSRRDAFAGTGPAAARPLIEKVTQQAHEVTDADIAAAKAAGLSEEQIFELVVTAAVGQANRQLDSALAVLGEVTEAT